VHTLFFVYYYGPGIVENGRTYGVTEEGNIDLENFIEDLASRANSYVVAFLDCSRIHNGYKGGK